MHLVLILTVGTNKINKGSILCFQVNSENSVFIKAFNNRVLPVFHYNSVYLMFIRRFTLKQIRLFYF